MFARIGLVSIINTLIGISVFPILKTVFHSQDNAVLMVISYALCVSLSFCLHGKISFRAVLSVSKFVAFSIVNLGSLLIMVVSVSFLAKMLPVDIRIIQPVVAVLLQFGVVLIYKFIFWERKNG